MAIKGLCLAFHLKEMLVRCQIVESHTCTHSAKLLTAYCVRGMKEASCPRWHTHAALRYQDDTAIQTFKGALYKTITKLSAFMVPDYLAKMCLWMLCFKRPCFWCSLVLYEVWRALNPTSPFQKCGRKNHTSMLPLTQRSEAVENTTRRIDYINSKTSSHTPIQFRL